MGADDAVSTVQEEADGKEFLGCCPGQGSPIWYPAKRETGHPLCQGTPGSLLPFLHHLHLLRVHQCPTRGWSGCRAGPGGGSGAAQRGSIAGQHSRAAQQGSTAGQHRGAAQRGSMPAGPGIPILLLPRAPALGAHGAIECLHAGPPVGALQHASPARLHLQPNLALQTPLRCLCPGSGWCF